MRQVKKSFWYKLAALFLVAALIVPALAGCVKEGPAGPQGPASPTPETNIFSDPVKVDSGLVAGTFGGSFGHEVHIYKGIPYAAPPVGDLRWKPPQPVTPWTGVRQATEFCPICPQSLTVPQQNEDCLYLNVYTPAKKTTDRLPVFVNIHGGAFYVGSSRQDMTKLAQQGVVGVSISYRLGPLGFMAHPLLSKESGKGVSGNYGLQDQVFALEWVKRNIAAFGGDPGNVTIYGCSAGGESVLDLMATPLSKGLFHRAIADAGAYTGRTPPLTKAEQTGEELAVKLGVSDKPDVLAALRALSVEKLIEYQASLGAAYGTFLPTVDGWFLPDTPLNVFKAGKQQDVPLMIGCGSADLGGRYALQWNKDFASAMSTVSSKAYAWVFSHVPAGSTATGGTHCLSMSYLFGSLSSLPQLNWLEEKISEDMMAIWLRFAATGNPGVSGFISWPAYEAATDQYLDIGDTLQIETGLAAPK